MLFCLRDYLKMFLGGGVEIGEVWFIIKVFWWMKLLKRVSYVLFGI